MKQLFESDRAHLIIKNTEEKLKEEVIAKCPAITESNWYMKTPLTGTNIHFLDGKYLCTIQKKDVIECLLLLVVVNKKKLSILITSDGTWYFVKFRFENTLYYATTLFLGQLVKNIKNNLWIFWIDDIIQSGADNYDNNLSLFQRLNYCNNLIKTQFKFDSTISVCDIRLSGYFTYNHFGLIRKNCYIIMSHLTDRSNKFIVDYRIEDKHHFHGQIKTLQITKTTKPDVYLLTEKRSKTKEVINRGVLGITSINMSQKVNLLVQEKAQSVECIYDEKFKSWFIKKYHIHFDK